MFCNPIHVRTAAAALWVCCLSLCLGCEEQPAGVTIAGVHCDHLFVHEVGDLIIEPKTTSQVVGHTFPFTNPSTSEAMNPVIELKSCGCVDARLREEHVPPRESGAVTMEFHPAYAEERRSETLVVKTGLANPARYAFQIVADVHPRLYFKNRDLLDIAVRPGQTASALIEITERPMAPILILDSPATPFGSRLSRQALLRFVKRTGSSVNPEPSGWPLARCGSMIRTATGSEWRK